MDLISERVYVLFAEWELAREQGRVFDLEQVTSILERSQLRELIDQLASGRASEPPSTPEPPPTPSETDRYRFTEFLAQGGMGEVWRGLDKSLGRPVALKVLRRRLGVSQSLFREEALRVARLSHPGIVAVHDLGRLPDGRPFFAMKLVEGRTLEEWLTDTVNRTDNPSDLLRAFRQICQAVAYAHAQDPPLVHRDLKPQNVMVGQFGDVYVMDWGIAKTVSRVSEPAVSPEPSFAESGGHRGDDGESRPLTSTGIAKGTLAYMAPEQYAGDSTRVGPATDVFGLGGILFRMLTGAAPFAVRDDFPAVEERLTACHASPGLVAIARTCLKPDPSERYRQASEVLQALAQFEAEQDRRVREAEIAEARRETERRERLRRRIWQIGLGTAALVLLCLALGLGVRQRATEARQAEERAELTQQAVLALTEARLLLKTAQDHPLERAGFHDAASAARRAIDRARTAQDPQRLQESEAILALITGSLADIPRNERFLTELAESRLPAEPRRAGDTAPLTAPLSQVTEERYLAAFRNRGIALNLETDSAEVCETRLKVLPKQVLPEVAAALDGFWIELVLSGRHSKPDRDRITTLIRLAYRLDNDLRSKMLRELVVVWLLHQTVSEAEVGALVSSARSLDLSTEPVSRIHLLYHTLRIFREGPEAGALLIRAVNANPRDASLLTAAALWHERLVPPEWDRAIEYRRALRTLHPETGLGLAYDLLQLDQPRPQEAELILRHLLQRGPEIPELHLALGISLSHDASRRRQEEAAYREAQRLRPDYAAVRRALEALHRATSEKGENAGSGPIP